MNSELDPSYPFNHQAALNRINAGTTAAETATGRTPYQGPGVRGFTPPDPYAFEDTRALAARTPSVSSVRTPPSALEQKSAYMANPVLTMGNLDRMQREAELSRLNAMSGPTNYQQNEPGMDTYFSPAWAQPQGLLPPDVRSQQERAMAAAAANPLDFASANQIITARGGPVR